MTLAEHQREAVARAEATLAARGGVILADEVGLGKSFVAAELMRRAQHAELVIPNALVSQWRETLATFHVEAELFTHDRIPPECSARPRLMVVDEAHAFRNPKTRRYAALAQRSVGARLLLVTATPICNSVADLEALVRLFARDDLLADLGVPSLDVAFATGDAEALAIIVNALVIRRDRSVLTDDLRFGELERRVVRHPIFTAAGEVARLIDVLQFPLVGDHVILRRFLWRRLESSEAALLESLRRQLRFYERARHCIASGRTLPKRDYRRAFGHEEDRDVFQQVLFWEMFAPAGEADPHAIDEEVARLEALVACIALSPRTKVNQLMELVREEREPMLIFTGAAATAFELYDALREIRRCGVVTARERSRDAVLDAFQRGRIDVLISTDLAAEGLNLQRAGVVVHYDIPWNPVKLDQRNGRAHRIGQTRDSVRAIYFLPGGSETRIVETIAKKNRVRRRVLQSGIAAAAARNQRTLRPRIAGDAAILAFADAARRAGLTLPESLYRRHRAGGELLLRTMAAERLDARRVADVAALLSR
ncbi:MAG TPA: DEAD/DEAH box helicase [Thermoanaerobaculia bacterium]